MSYWIEVLGVLVDWASLTFDPSDKIDEARVFVQGIELGFNVKDGHEEAAFKVNFLEAFESLVLVPDLWHISPRDQNNLDRHRLQQF